MFVIHIVEIKFAAGDKRVEVAETASESDGLLLRIQIDNFRVFFFRVKRNTIAILVKSIVHAEKAFIPIVTEAAGTTLRARERIWHQDAFARYVITRSFAAPIAPEQPVRRADFDAAAAAELLTI